MTTEFALQANQVHELLERSGYDRLPRHLGVGDMSLEIDDAWNGPSGTLDLAVVSTRPQSKVEESRLYWGVQRLVRALEAAESKRTITVILIGASELTTPELRRAENELQTLARVLILDGSAPADRALSPLTILELPTVEERDLDAVGLVQKTIGSQQRALELTSLLAAAEDGPRAVEARYIAWIDQAFSPRSGAN